MKRRRIKRSGGNWCLKRMRLNSWTCLLVCLPLTAQNPGEFTKEEKVKAGDHTRALIAAAPMLPFKKTEMTVQPASAGWEMGRISCIAIDAKGG